MPSVLSQIIASTRVRVAAARNPDERQELEKRAQNHIPRGFRKHLETASLSRPAVIAELKKASPSRGLIRKNFDAATLARELELAGAAALSVLTDEQYFQGSLENLRNASAAVKLPCLRKDFIVDEFQIAEARANSADAILLIVAALSQSELEQLSRKAREYELDVLCEAHDQDELQRSLDAGSDMVGINSRDLRTFQVDVENTVRLARSIPKGVLGVAESGIHTAGDIARLRDAGYQAFLIGESLMKAESPGGALHKLLEISDR